MNENWNTENWRAAVTARIVSRECTPAEIAQAELFEKRWNELTEELDGDWETAHDLATQEIYGS